MGKMKEISTPPYYRGKQSENILKIISFIVALVA
jgi:hypothetical protein